MACEKGAAVRSSLKVLFWDSGEIIGLIAIYPEVLKILGKPDKNRGFEFGGFCGLIYALSQDLGRVRH
jgi:hypothetical protein